VIPNAEMMNTKRSPLVRNRLLYILAVAILVVVSLPTRSSAAQYMPLFVVLYVGDTLWAMAIFLTFGVAFPKWRTRDLALFVLAGCWAVEFSQSYHTEWLDAIRRTTVGGLILGHGFLWSDVICYAIGVGLGVLLELAIWSLLSRRTPVAE
jgi:hypothetical protein